MNTRDCEIPNQRGPRRGSTQSPSQSAPVLETTARAFHWEPTRGLY